MTLEEIKELKTQCEADILNIIDRFESMSGLSINLKKEQQKSDLRNQLDQKIKENKALSGMLYTLVFQPESKQANDIKEMVKRWAEFNQKKNGK